MSTTMKYTNEVIEIRTTNLIATFVLLVTGLITTQLSWAQDNACADWGETETQLLQLEVGETKTFQLPTASHEGGASCTAESDDIVYSIDSQNDLPTGFTFDEDEVTVTGCSTTTLSSYRIKLVAAGPSSCDCAAASLDALMRIKPNDDGDTSATCPADAEAVEEDTVALDQTPPDPPWYGWSQVKIGERWVQSVGHSESDQGARITYTARCAGEYDLADNFVGSCPSILRSIDVGTFANGVTYVAKTLSRDRGNIGIYRIRVTASKEDVTRTAQTTVILEIVGNDPKAEPPVITAPEPKTLRIIWETDEDRRDYITGFDLEFRRADRQGDTSEFELVPSTTSLTIGDLVPDTEYEARIRYRGGIWSDWASEYTLGNNAPSFDATEYNFRLRENESGRTERIRLGKVSATDPNPGDSVTYSLEPTDKDRFEIGKTNGNLYYTGDGEDHESTPTINVKVTATGGTGSRALSASVIATVKVTNVSEALYFDEDEEIVFDEEFTQGQYVEIDLPRANGGDGAITYTAEPDLPAGLSIGERNGVLSGTPSETTDLIEYKYIATDEEGESVSLPFEIRVFGASPKRPTDLTVKDSTASSITITWTNPFTPFITLEYHYIEYRKPGAEEWSSERIDATETEYTLGGLERNTAYRVRVKNAADTGFVATSETIDASTSAHDVPGVPRSITVTNREFDSLTLTWQRPKDTGGRNIAVYDVRYREQGTTEWSEEEVRNRTITLEDLKLGTNYEIQIRAVNSVGNGPWSKTIVESTLRNTRPVFPAGTSITNQVYTVGEAIPVLQLPTATSGDGVLRYTINPVLPQGISFNSQLLQLSGTPTTVQRSVTYRFMVADSDPFIDDDTSELEFRITVNANTPLPPHPTIGEVSFDEALVRWRIPNSRGASIVEYELEVREAGSTDIPLSFTSETTTYQIVDLTPLTEYEVRVRAVNNIGASEWSAWIAFMTTKVPEELRARPIRYASDALTSSLGGSTVSMIGARAISVQVPENEGDNSIPPYFYQPSSSLGFSDLIRLGNWSENRSSRNSTQQFNALSSLRVTDPSSYEDDFSWSVWFGVDVKSDEANVMDEMDNQNITVPIETSYTSGWLGGEVGFLERYRAGFAVARSSTNLEARRFAQGLLVDSEDRDEVDISVSTFNPYVVVTVSEDFTVWGTFGFGSGKANLVDKWGEIEDVEIDSNVVAAGARYKLNSIGIDGITVIGDYFQATSESQATTNFSIELSSDIRRLRAGVEGQWSFNTADMMLIPTAEIFGQFEDGGIADGTNIDIGAGIEAIITDSWSVGAKVRFLRSMEEEQYSATAFSILIRRESSTIGGGSSFTLEPSRGSVDHRTYGLPDEKGFGQLNDEDDELRTRMEWAYHLTAQDSLAEYQPYSALTIGQRNSSIEFGVRWLHPLTQGNGLNVELSSTTVELSNREFSTSIRLGFRILH